MKNSVLQQITLPDLNGGLNTHDPEYNIADNQSPDMLNLWYKDMALCKRPGQAWLSQHVNVYHISELYNGARVIHAGTKLYRWNADGMERNIGEFNPTAGYPIGAKVGDYSIANAAGSLLGKNYEAGDAIIYDGVQVISATVVGMVTASGNAAVKVERTGTEGALLSMDIPVEEGNTAAEVAGKVRTALAAHVAVSALYAVGGTDTAVVLTQIVPGSQDERLALSIGNGTCAGLTMAIASDASVWRTANTEMQDEMENIPGTFCEFGDRLYYFGGSEIWEIAPDFTVKPVTPYVPVVMMNASPNLKSGDDNEAYNLIGAGLTVWYNGEGGNAINYQLPQKGLDNTEVRVNVNAVDLKEGINFTVNRMDGTVDFTGGASPYGAPEKGTNNVWVTAYKTTYEEDGFTPKKNRITRCTLAVRFGGEAAGVVGGTRVFAMANPNYPYRYWRSDLGLHVSSGVGYFPDTSEELLDQNSEAITAAAKMGDELIIFKENSIFAVGYSFDGKDVYYPVRECHITIGCDMPGSVQLIDNQLVFAHSKSGVHMLVTLNNELENIVKPISANINSLLLKENNLKGACSCDYDRYYWLCTSGRVYLWDYDTTPYYNYADYDKAQKRLAWYRFDHVSASVFFEDGGLCYGGAAGIVKFTKSRNDFGQAISAYFKSKAFDMGSPEEEKTIMWLYPSFSADGNILAKVTVGNGKIDLVKEAQFDIRSFDWSAFGWNAFTWNRIKYARTYAMRLNMRRTAFLQIMVSGGEEIDRGVGLTGLRITYYVNRKMKRG